MTHEGTSEQLKGLEGNPWRGAEAYHFCLLAHQQLYAGQVGSMLPHSVHLSCFAFAWSCCASVQLLSHQLCTWSHDGCQPGSFKVAWYERLTTHALCLCSAG